MIKIGFLKEIDKVRNLPKEVIESIKKILTVLENEYGTTRCVNDDGGYILILESKEDLELIKSDIYLDLEIDAIPEFVDLINCQNGDKYTNSLILCNNDFGISVIMPLSMTPQNLKEYIV